jgi:hypothetical protein
MPRGPTAIRVANSLRTHVENCAFLGPSGRVLEWRGDGSRQEARVSVRNSVQAGSELLSVIARGRTIAINLAQNTIASQTLVHAPTPLSIAATNNVFVVDTIHHRDARAPHRPLEEVLRWDDARNVFAVRGAFAHFGFLDQPASSPLVVPNFESWKAVLKITAESSVLVPGGLFGRFQTNVTLAEPDKFAYFQLTPEEQAVVKAQRAGQITTPGADLKFVGPGAAYAAWRASARYQEWRELVRQQGFRP